MKKKSKSNDVVLRANDMKYDNGASYSGAIKDATDAADPLDEPPGVLK